MCGRLTQQLSSDEIARLFGAETLDDDPGGHFNVAPTQQIRGVSQPADHRIVTPYRWGLVPSWAKSLKDGPPLINARAETVAEKPAFRAAFRKQRCVIPADAFYEWRRDGATKTPHAIARRDGRLLTFAGLWSSWRDRENDRTIQSCALITTSANEMMATIHYRMPVILPETAWDDWLDPDNDNVGALLSLLAPGPDGDLLAYPISRLVNDVRHDGPELLEPLLPAAGPA